MLQRNELNEKRKQLKIGRPLKHITLNSQTNHRTLRSPSISFSTNNRNTVIYSVNFRCYTRCSCYLLLAGKESRRRSMLSAVLSLLFYCCCWCFIWSNCVIGSWLFRRIFIAIERERYRDKKLVGVSAKFSIYHTINQLKTICFGCVWM